MQSTQPSTPSLPREVALVIARLAAEDGNGAVPSVCRAWYRETRRLLADLRVARWTHKEIVRRLLDDSIHVSGSSTVGSINYNYYTVYTTVCQVLCHDCRVPGRHEGKHLQKTAPRERVVVLRHYCGYQICFSLHYHGHHYPAPVLICHLGHRRTVYGPDGLPLTVAGAEDALRQVLGPVDLIVMPCRDAMYYKK